MRSACTLKYENPRLHTLSVEIGDSTRLLAGRHQLERSGGMRPPCQTSRTSMRLQRCQIMRACDDAQSVWPLARPPARVRVSGNPRLAATAAAAVAATALIGRIRAACFLSTRRADAREHADAQTSARLNRCANKRRRQNAKRRAIAQHRRGQAAACNTDSEASEQPAL